MIGLRPVQRKGLVVLSTFFLIISISFIIQLVQAFFISDHLFIVKKRIQDLFFYFKRDGDKTILCINFYEWRRSVFGKFSFIFAMIYEHVLDYYLVVMYIIAVMNVSLYNTLLLILIMFLITSQTLPRLARFSIRKMSGD